MDEKTLFTIIITYLGIMSLIPVSYTHLTLPTIA